MQDLEIDEQRRERKAGMYKGLPNSDVHPFSKNVWSTYCAPGTGEAKVDKAERVSQSEGKRGEETEKETSEYTE